jgi:UPF0755 protein
VSVTVPRGATTGTLAGLLDQHGVIRDAWLFHLYLRYKGVGAFEAGDYTFHHQEGYASALRDLDQGPTVASDRLTIPEGFTLAQIADRVGRLPGRSAQRFLDLSRGGAVRSIYEPPGSTNLEGLVFPDTYRLLADEDEQVILTRMVAEFDATAARLGMGPPDGSAALLRNGLTAYQTVIVASIVEREAKVPEDRGKIARVIVNRLRQRMKLQIDATVLYALSVQKTAITAADLNVDSPYNTYRVSGLPPAPISNPGRASLLAALDPTPGPWLYYVLAAASGRHAFAVTSADFERLKSQARARGLLG